MRTDDEADLDDRDDQLAARAAQGDGTAFHALIDRHYDRVYRVALGVLANAADAEDVAQDVWAALPKRLASWRGEAAFTTWLHRVALNAARDALRRAGSRTRTASDFIEIDGLRRAAQEDDAKRLEWLECSLSTLGADLRETAAFVLGEGLTHAAAGEILGVAEATISWRMSEMRRRLRALARDDGAPAQDQPAQEKPAATWSDDAEAAPKNIALDGVDIAARTAEPSK